MFTTFRRSLQDRSAHSGHRARRRGHRFRRHRFRSHIQGETIRSRYLGRARRLRQQDATAARHRRASSSAAPTPTRISAIARWPTNGSSRNTTGSSAPRIWKPPSSIATTPSSRPGEPSASTIATVGGRILAFNYRTIYMTEDERLDLHRRFIVDHYLQTVQPGDHRHPATATPAASHAPPSAKK